MEYRPCIVGLNLQNVTTMAIGIDGNGASGTLYLDDIRLYRLAPELARYRLDSAPVFDGMAAANGRLYLSLENGQVLCMAGQ